MVKKFVLDEYVTHVKYIVAFQHLLATGKRPDGGDGGGEPSRVRRARGLGLLQYAIVGVILKFSHTYTHTNVYSEFYDTNGMIFDRHRTAPAPARCRRSGPAPGCSGG